MVNSSLKKLDNITKKGDTYPIETKHTNGIRVMKIISRKEAKEQGLKRYFTGNPCKHRHISERNTKTGKCLECHKQRMSAVRDSNRKVDESVIKRLLSSEWKTYFQSPEQQAKRREANRLHKQWKKDPEYLARQSEASKRYRTKPETKEKAREYYRKTIDARRKYAREWARINVDFAEKARKYRRDNPEASFSRSSLQRLERGFEIERFESIFKYTRNEFINCIESQFVDGMTWENRSEWHIDHIKPIKAFIDGGITDPAIINALDNLQPLWAHENLSKGAKHER